MAGRVCEICGTEATSNGEPDVKLDRVLIGERLFALCQEHHRQIESAGVRDLPQLFELFREPGGRRGTPERRSPLDRRVFPPRPEGRRAGKDRRAPG